MPMIISSSYQTCFGCVSVKTATWVIAIVHLILVGYIWVMGIMYFLGLTDKDVPHTSIDEHVNFAGKYVYH
jgi:hypothetical protein